jgi:glycogen operon protein
MLLGGDEFGRTQNGNNNAYCQDNPISWHNWHMLQDNSELFRFCKEIIRFRRENRVFCRPAYFRGKPAAPGAGVDLSWYDAAGGQVNWSSTQPYLACLMDPTVNRGTAIYMMFNPSLAAADYLVPEGRWHLCVHTGRTAPLDVQRYEGAEIIEGPALVSLDAKSMAVLAHKAVAINR